MEPQPEPKYCCYCKVTKTVTDFYRDKSRPDGLNHRCKECTKKYHNGRRANGEARRRYELKHYYGITPEEYQTLEDAQNGGCAVCGLKPEKVLAVDHCHATDRIRGLLCRTCNSALGLLKDDPQILKNAIKYLVEADRVEKC